MDLRKSRFPLALVIALALIFSWVVMPGLAEAKKKPRFFEITLITPIGNQPREKAGQIIARDLEKIGIGVNLRYMEFASITPRWKMTAKTGAPFKDGGYDMIMLQTDSDSSVDCAGIFQRLGCDQVHPAGRNRFRYCNPDADKLLYKALSIPDNKKRWATVHEAMRMVYADMPSIPLWHPAQFYGVASNVKWPEHKDVINWQTYSFRWAKREIAGKKKADMSLRERTLVYAAPSGVDTFLPGYSGSSYTDRAIVFMVYDSLVARTLGPYYRGPKDKRGPKGALAESWETSPDGKVWTMKLRKGVTWHDGKPFTADDVIFTYDLMMNPKYGYRGPSKFVKTNGIKWSKIDDHTVKFTGEKYSPLFVKEMFWNIILPKHAMASIPPEQLKKSDFNTGKKTIGTGPFKLVENKPGEYLKYEPYDKYWGGKPWFDQVVFRIIPETATAWFALKTGEVDVTEKWYGFTRELAEVEADPKLTAYKEPSFGPQQIWVNNVHPILKNKFVKKAISLVCNRDIMVKIISNNLGVKASQLVPPWSPGFVKDLGELKYDMNEAKKMMIKAGYNYDDISVKGPK
jgi:ABC-type transport system substrate-binding protein